MTVSEACIIQCQAEQDLACYDAQDCVYFCTDPLDPGSDEQTICKPEYTAMVLCQAQLTAEQWYCSDLGAGWYLPAPIQGPPCEEQVCGWTCCDQGFLTLPEVYDRCGCTPL